MRREDESRQALGDSNVDALVRSASRWIRQALIGWADDDFAVVAMLAPIAVEHLGKAALWNRHPVLLVPLTNTAEESLHLLTARADIISPKLRTIGLAGVLQRVARYLDPFPLGTDAVRSLVEVRNGSVHVGARNASKTLLTDALRLCASLLADLNLSHDEFFTDQAANVQGLLAEKRSEVEADVAAKRARARNHLSLLEDKLGPEVFGEAISSLEDEAAFVVDAARFSSFDDSVAIAISCPECGRRGRSVGRLDADAEPDWDVEKVGDDYEPYVSGTYWSLSFTPAVFVCNVCKLELFGTDELSAAGLPCRSYVIESDALDDGFDIDAWARRMYMDTD